MMIKWGAHAPLKVCSVLGSGDKYRRADCREDDDQTYSEPDSSADAAFICSHMAVSSNMREYYRGDAELFSSMKSDIGIRPIRAWTDDGVYGVLLIGFLAQALIAMTRLQAKPADGKATKFLSDAMQKLTLTVRKKGIEGTEFILSSFNPLNQSILKAFGVIPEVFRCENTRK